MERWFDDCLRLSQMPPRMGLQGHWQVLCDLSMLLSKGGGCKMSWERYKS